MRQLTTDKNFWSENKAASNKLKKISIVEKETNPVIVLLRNELRLCDNPLLSYAASLQRPVCPLYVWAPEKNNKWSLENTACGIWLQESLNNLDAKLRDAVLQVRGRKQGGIKCDRVGDQPSIDLQRDLITGFLRRENDSVVLAELSRQQHGGALESRPLHDVVVEKRQQ